MQQIFITPPRYRAVTEPGSLSTVAVVSPPQTTVGGNPATVGLLDIGRLNVGDLIGVRGAQDAPTVHTTIDPTTDPTTVTDNRPGTTTGAEMHPVFGAFFEVSYSVPDLKDTPIGERILADYGPHMPSIAARAWVDRVAAGEPTGLNATTSTVAAGAFADTIASTYRHGHIVAMSVSVLAALGARVTYRGSGLWLDHTTPIWAGTETQALGNTVLHMPAPTALTSDLAVGRVRMDTAKNDIGASASFKAVLILTSRGPVTQYTIS